MTYEKAKELLLKQYETIKDRNDISLVEKMKPIQKLYCLTYWKISIQLEQELKIKNETTATHLHDNMEQP